jgi:hypothetical protein
MTTSPTSPSASGPAGALFEGQVGAHYLLTLLAEAEPRGMPGVRLTQVELQRVGEGHPLDDVIVRGTTAEGRPAVLEIQAKRTIAFSPSDAVFMDVVQQLGEALQTLDWSSHDHQFAVATERTSAKITGPYQDVLRWARDLGSASLFFSRLDGKKVGNDDMRAFVRTLRTHLASFGYASDDESVWQLLRRFQILTFDFGAPGSQSSELAVERARHVLGPENAADARALWSTLNATAIRTAASGGDLDRSRLVAGLAVSGFHIGGSRRHRLPRETLSEVAQLATAELKGSIAGTTLARASQVSAVRAALELGRYAEIRGVAGVGKSGILGLLLEQVLTECRAIVLSPARTPPGGWLALKAALGVDASAQEFLSDLASDGGAVLFIDGLDFFADAGARTTIIDLLRSTADVPGFRAVITARASAADEELDWLPADALAKLGRAPAVVVEELASEEIEELEAAAPQLRALLADDHPARELARNLFRLSRLLKAQGSQADLRTEVDLMERWWSTADGELAGRRARGQLLEVLADSALIGQLHVDTAADSAAIDALVASGTLQESRRSRVSLRHDVLREWAVASRIYEEPDLLARLPLQRRAPTSLVRAIELRARLALERKHDGEAWVTYLANLSPEGAHGSWRQSALLAILRSERGLALLDQAAAFLFAQDGALLRELIRTTIAVESQPLTELFVRAGIEAASIPEGLFGPANESWSRLALWLVRRRTALPIQALPEVVKLFQDLSVSMRGVDPLTPLMAVALADWLDEIEDACDHRPLTKGAPRFATVYGYGDLFRLADDVRHAFAFMASRAPERAQAYLRGILKRRNPERAIRDVMKVRAMFPVAAPAELVELTLAGLIPPEDGDRRTRRSIRRDVLSHLDSDFLPSSPARGPFLDLLKFSPEHGLALIRRLVDYVIASATTRAPRLDESLSLVFDGRQREFPYARTYRWSRDAHGAYAIECALMALEAWSHARIEKGDAPRDVIADILGPDGTPAAFLLVAVDVLLSHWPKTRADSIPFLGCPELLTLDRTRQHYDSLPDMRGLGIVEFAPNAPGAVASLDALRNRRSRRAPLERLLAFFAHNEGEESSELRRLLTAAAERLGPVAPGDTFADPRFVTRYALNLTDAANWRPHEQGRIYMSPPAEAEHLARLQEQLLLTTGELTTEAAVSAALEGPATSSPELVSRALALAQRLQGGDEAVETMGSRDDVVVAAAMLVARDGTTEVFEQNEVWLRQVFADVIAGTKEDVARGMREGVRYNPVAIATLGSIHVWRRRRLDADRTRLLELAGRKDAESAQGFGAAIDVLLEVDPRVIPAVLRCALSAQIFVREHWDDTDDVKARQRERRAERIAAAVSSESAWLSADGLEPPWPRFPEPEIHLRRRLRIGAVMDAEPPPTEDHPREEVLTQTAALWLRQMTHRRGSAQSEWLPGFIRAYDSWTRQLNGEGCERDAELDHRPHEWNNVYFPLFAETLMTLTPDGAADAIDRAIDVPDDSFFAIAETLVPALDDLHFNGRGLDAATSVRVRERVAERLVQCAGWRRARDASEMSVEMRIAPAIAALFFNHHSIIGGAGCYLKPKGIDQVEPHFPLLERLIAEGSVPFTAVLTLNLMEVSPRPEHASFLVGAALIWLKRQGTNAPLWVAGGLGERITAWLHKVMTSDETLRSVAHPLRAQIDDVLARLIQVGVADARRLERTMVQATH